MTLKTKAICEKVLKKSTSPAFNNLQVGDIIYFSIPMESVGRNGSVCHAAYINCKNMRTEAESNLSFNQIGKILECGEFLECP